jgi:hypothetical protein
MLLEEKRKNGEQIYLVEYNINKERYETAIS